MDLFLSELIIQFMAEKGYTNFRHRNDVWNKKTGSLFIINIYNKCFYGSSIIYKLLVLNLSIHSTSFCNIFLKA